MTLSMRNLLNCMLYRKMFRAYGRTEGWKICCWKWPYVNLICFLYRNVGVQTNWLNPWHEILHDWNARVARYVQEAGILTWSQRSLQQYWHLCSYIAGLPDARWASRILVWRPRNTGKRGAPLRIWHSAAETFCRWKALGDWKTAAMNTQRWYEYTADFCSFIFES